MDNSNFIEYVGVLANDDDIHSYTGEYTKQAVFINSQNDIQYQVKALSDMSPTRFYTGYISSIVDNEKRNLDDFSSDDTFEKRCAAFRDRIRDYLFVFTTREPQSSFPKIGRANLVEWPSAIKEDDMLISAPVFSPKGFTSNWEYEKGPRLYRNYDNYEEFKDQLSKGLPIGRVYRYSTDNQIRFVVWYEENENGNKICALGPITNIEYTANNSYILRFDELHEIDLTDYIDYSVYAIDVNPTVIHLVDSVYETITNQFVTQKDTLPLAIETKVENKSSSSNIETTQVQEEVISIDNTVKDDLTLLKTFNKLCEDNNLYFDPKDLTNVHSAIKTGNLVVLSGMSGTGKSAIVDMYARALGLRSESDDSRVLIIPVRPSWNDDQDLLGYVDLVHMVYRASDTGFIKLLVEASKEENKNKLYFVCFDEMNLARVEHYFSQFLSILEKPSGRRRLRLYDEQLKGKLYNSAEYPDVIQLNDNIRFVGTVNIDESTYHFADKVLDRANVINLHVLPFNSWKKHLYTTNAIQEWTTDEYQSISQNNTNVSQNEIKDFLWELHLVLQGISSSLGIGPRVVKSIEAYLSNVPAQAERYKLTMGEALDLQVKQRVLTKVRGSDEQLNGLGSETGEKTIESVFDEFSNLSDFVESRQTLEQKKKELKVYGYCL